MLNIELKDHIEYVNNTLLLLIDHPLASVRNKALESVKENARRFLSEGTTSNLFEKSLILAVEERLEVLSSSKNPSTRFNAVDLIDCLIHNTNHHQSKKFTYEKLIDLLLERCFDVSARVRKKSIDITCALLEDHDSHNDSDMGLIEKGLPIITTLINSVITYKTEATKVSNRIVSFLSKVLFSENIKFELPSLLNTNKRGKKAAKPKFAGPYDCFVHIYSNVIYSEEETFLDQIMTEVILNKNKETHISLGRFDNIICVEETKGSKTPRLKSKTPKSSQVQTVKDKD